MAYSRLPISIITVLKSSAPVCIYTAAVIAGVERFNIRTSIVCVWIATSVAFAIPPEMGENEVQSNYLVGIFMVVTAVLCLSIRWVIVHSLTRRFTPVQLVYLIQPSSAVVMLPFALGIECNSSLSQSLSTQPLAVPLVLIFGSAFAALALLLFEYKIVHDTSSLTLSIGGIGKEILTLCLSMLIFKESFTLRQIIATSASIAGILVYALIRTRDDNGGYSPPPSAEPKAAIPSHADEESKKSIDEFGAE
jgi:solute carrier family 35 protein C2